MRVLKEIYLSQKDIDKMISFGLVDNEQEAGEIFRLRYKIYLKMGYISKEMFPDEIERDEYDEGGKCDYFIAKFKNQIIGSARVIKDYYLPTETECFKFEEPRPMRAIPRNKRGEISRLIVIGTKDYSLPPYLVILGILDSIIKIALEKDLEGGYSFIKEPLRKKLNRIGVPFHIIRPFVQVYSKKYLWGYFHNPNDPAIPIYYLRDEGKKYLDQIFNNERIFKKINHNKFLYLLNKPWKFLFYINPLSLFSLWK